MLRILFDSKCFESFFIIRMKQKLDFQGLKWIWKNEKNDFDSFLITLNYSKQLKIIDKETLYKVFAFSLKAIKDSREDFAQTNT